MRTSDKLVSGGEYSFELTERASIWTSEKWEVDGYEAMNLDCRLGTSVSNQWLATQNGRVS
jgi:hypothetical protein